MMYKIIILLFVFILLTIRIYKDGEKTYTVQLGLIPLIEYYKRKKRGDL